MHQITEMKFLNHLALGYKSYYEAIKVILRYNLWWFFLFPLALSVGIYYLGEYLDSFQYENFSTEKLNEIENINELTWLIIKTSFWVTLGYLGMKFTKYLVVIILSPVLAILSETVETKLTGNTYAFDWIQLFHDVRRGVRIALRNVFWEYFLFTIVLVVGMFFGGDFKKIFIFSIPLAFGFYFYGFGFIDYINERRRLNITQSVYFVRQHRGVAIAIGSVYSLLFMVPYVGVILAPILAIIAATLAVHELVDLGSNQYAVKKDMVTKQESNTD